MILHSIFFFIFLWFLWSIGEALEENLGSFHLNLYFLVSMAAVVGVSFLQPAVPVNSFYLFNALFLGFATTLPDQKIFLFPIPIPLSVLWVAGVTSALLFIPVFFEPALLPGLLAGSAIFFHLCRANDAVTTGCTSMEEPAFRTLLESFLPKDEPVYVSVLS